MQKLSIEKKFILFFSGYLLIHFILRIIVSGSVEKDEAEIILLLQQQFSWGYQAQPPLYSWLQLAFFNIFGWSVFSLALLKNILVFIIYFFLYKSAKLVLKDELRAIFSSISLLLVYNFSWIIHRDLTHSVGLLAVCSLTLYVFLKMLFERKLKWYVLLGILIGLGLLAKYNYSVFIVALILSAVGIKNYRSVIINKKMLLVLAITIFVIAPHILWSLNHLSELLSDVGDFRISDGSGRLNGFWMMLNGSFLFLLPLVVVYALFFPKGFRRKEPKDRETKDTRHFFEMFLLFSFLIISAISIVYGVQQIKIRWLQPILFITPLYFFIRCQAIKTNFRRNAIFIILVISCALGMSASIWGRVYLAGHREKYKRLNYPYLQLSELIEKNHFQKGLIIAGDNVVGANLRLRFKDSLVVTPHNFRYIDLNLKSDNILVVWESDVEVKGIPPDIIEIMSELDLGFSKEKIITERALYNYSTKDYYEIKLFVIS